MADYWIGLGVGVFIGASFGWLKWRMPWIHAEQRGREIEEDGVCVCGRPLPAATKEAS